MKKIGSLLKRISIVALLTLFTLTGLNTAAPVVHAATTGAAATADYGTKDLTLGSQGSTVTKLQKDLAGLGFYANSIDGSFGSKTRDAVVAFQKSQRLKTDGVVGSITKAALNKALIENSPKTQDLTLGSQGSTVTKLQKDLAGLGFYANSIDGSFGSKTRDAVVAFQKSQGLKTDGVVGSITRTALDKALLAPSKAKKTTVTIAAGTIYATPMYIIDSGKSGPTVMIVGGVHGNEPAGYTAAAKVKDLTIKKGKLIVLPQANKKAVANKTRTYGGVDLNRQFPQSKTQSAKTTLSKAIWEAVKKYDVDWLMDMHEGYNYSTVSDSVGQSLIYCPNTATQTMVAAIAKNLNAGISTTYKKFSQYKYPVKGSLARAAGDYQGVNAFIFETATKPSLDVRVNYQLKAANTLLSRLGMI